MIRLTLSRQLLMLQMCIVVLVVVAVAGVSVVASDQSFRKDESRRMLGAAEALARDALVLSEAGDAPGLSRKERDEGVARLDAGRRVQLERARASAGASYAVLLDEDDSVVVSTRPLAGGEQVAIREDVRFGASWRGTTERFDRRTIEAQVAVLSAEQGHVGEVIGYIVVGHFYPSRMEVLSTAAPSFFGFLALAGAIGAAGSLLLARRVKRQTLGLEPREIAGLMEQREAMLHGVREGVLGVDLRGVVAFANDEALRLLGLRPPVLGRPISELGQEPEVAAVLTGAEQQYDAVVAIAGRMLVLNSRPVHVRRKQTGWVTSMRDRTELLDLQQELEDAQAGTDTLRAQVHEFRNRLHAIAGMAELGHTDELRGFVQEVMTNLDARVDSVADQVEDPAVAALVVAKASRADELNVDFTLDEDAWLGAHEPRLSADLVTVVGNLLDNAFEAVAGQGGEVQLDLADDGEWITIEVRDNGSGLPGETAEQAFGRGWTTKPDPSGHGFGLALTRMACQRHGGSVEVRPGEGGVLRARMRVTSQGNEVAR